MNYLSQKKGFLGYDAGYKIKNKVVVIPFGLEKTVSYGGGTKNGPKEIITASHQVELFDEELNKEPYKIILFGGGAEETQTLQSFADKYPNCVSVAGRFSFAEELALISHLDAMLAMDSGNGHLAALFGIPVVTMWGVTHPYLGFTPYGQPEENQLLSDRKQFPAIPTSVYGNKVPADYEKAMYSIKPQQVVDRIKTILA